MFKSSTKKEKKNELHDELSNLKNDLYYIQQSRKYNPIQHHSNLSFIKQEVEEKKKDFSIITGGIKKNKIKKTSKPNLMMQNRIQNYDINDSFCLKFKKTSSDSLNEYENLDNENYYTKTNINDHEQIIDTQSEIYEETESIFFHEDQEVMEQYNEKYEKNKQEIYNKSEKNNFININEEFLYKYLKNGNIIANEIFTLSDIKDVDFIIPRDCYTTWHTKNLPPLMVNNYKQLKENNQEIKFHLYNEYDCKKFIQNNFDKSVINAYNALVPSSYKSDLWRFCILYKKGGIYLDIKYNTINNFKLIELCDSEHFVFDHYKKNMWEENSFGVYTSLIVCKPNSKILFDCIYEIVDNVNSNNYGKNALYPTGPGLLGKNYLHHSYNNKNMSYIENIILFHQENSNKIIFKNTEIMDIYEDYRIEQNEYQNNLHYSNLWNQNCIYRKNFTLVQKNNQEIIPKLPHVLCIFHIGSYHIFLKMKKYIDNLFLAKYDEFNLTLYINIINSIKQEHINEIKKIYVNQNIIISENYGFDIGSFFHILQTIKERKEKYDFIIKLHTKTNNQLREKLLQPLLKNIQTIKNIIQKFESNEKIGIIGSKECRCIDAHVDFLRNKQYLQELMNWYFNEHTHIIKQPYVTGTIFWVRFNLIEKLFMHIHIPNIYNSLNNEKTFDWNWYYYANTKQFNNIINTKENMYNHYLETGKICNLSRNIFHALDKKTNQFIIRDGMIEHAYERFFCYACHRLGFKSLFIT